MDSYNSRKTDYLRISVTDRCNLRCIYCIPREGIITKPREEILTFGEILRLADIFASLGIKKIRLTGGEPLVRKGVLDLIRSLIKIDTIEDVSLTTNGTLLPLYAKELRAAGINRINISLDTLDEDKFKKITGMNSLKEVLEGIDKAKEAGFYPLKLNMVIMKGINEDEIINFVNFAASKGLVLRFIEFMKVTPLWREDYFISIEEVKEICQRNFTLTKMKGSGSGPAVYYRTAQGATLGFIKTDENNCRVCSRLRLTSTGELKNCVYEKHGLSLRELLREGNSDQNIEDVIKKRIGIKQDHNHYFNCESPALYMSAIGG
ncbi:MAG: GTP 3',8-cyclase MoaA [bacterium]